MGGKKGTEKPDQSPFTHKRREEGNREARSKPVCSQEKRRREQRSPIRARLLTREGKKGTEKPDQSPFAHKRSNKVIDRLFSKCYPLKSPTTNIDSKTDFPKDCP